MKLELISKYPPGNAHATPLLFVHGAWHAAWCWDVHFLDYFAAAGFASHAVSLRGHGASEGHDRLRWTRIAEYVEDVAQTAKEFSSPPVVIGHSMGGRVIQKYLEKYDAPAAVLLSSVPPCGVLAATLRIARRHPWIFTKINLTLSLYPLVANAELAREAFFSEGLAENTAQAYAKQLQDESYLSYLDMMLFHLPKAELIKTPVLVLGGARDKIFMPGEFAATARAFKTQPEIFPETAHDMMLEPRWQDVADRIVRWLIEGGL
jgi:pimeloyl-ACP methyl ester carboxylesterase